MKKWTYLVASLLLAGTTPLLTGCVDTDEPSGIEELRGAKAELLKAKAAVEAAKVAYVQAEAAYKNAEAEYKKAQAARELANAENDRLLAEQQIKEAIAKAEEAAYAAELKYQELQEAYQQALITLLSSKEAALAPYRGNLTLAKIALDKAADELTDKQRAYAKALATLEETEADKEYYTRDQQFEVIKAQRKLAAEQVALEEQKALYEEAQNIKLDDLAVRSEELKAKVEAMDKELAEVEAACAEAIYKIESTEGIAFVKDAYKWYDGLNEEQALPAVSIELNGAFPDGIQGTIESVEAVYTLNDPSNYYHRVQDLEWVLDGIKEWVRDENDNEWTKENIAKLEYELEVMLEQHKATLTKWKEAVAAYHTNEYPTTDPTKITGYAELKSAVDVYNTAANAYNDLEAKWTAADKALKAAKKDAEDKLGTDLTGNAGGSILKAYSDAVVAATKTQADAIANASTEAKKQYDALVASRDAAKKELDAANAALAKDPTNKDLQTAQAIAQIIYNTAKQAVIDNPQSAIEAKIIADANKAYADATAAALKTKNEAVVAAQKEFNETTKAQQAILSKLGAFNEEGTELYVAYEAAKAAAKKADDAFAVFNKNASKKTDWIYGFVAHMAKRTQDAKTEVWSIEVVTIDEVAALNKEGLIKAIKKLSNQLFGTDNQTNDYGDLNARLIEYTSDEIKKLAEEEIEALKSDYKGFNGHLEHNLISFSDYKGILDNYGMVGSEIALQEQIKLLNSYLTNSADVDALIAAVQKEYDTTVANYEAVMVAAYVAKVELEERAEAIVESLDEAMKPYDLAVLEQEPIRELQAWYEDIITDLMNGKDENDAHYDAAALESYVVSMKEALETAEDNVYTAQSALMKAEKKLAEWNSGNKSILVTAQEDLEDAQTEYKRAEEAYQAALDALNAAIEYLSTIK